MMNRRMLQLAVCVIAATCVLGAEPTRLWGQGPAGGRESGGKGGKSLSGGGKGGSDSEGPPLHYSLFLGNQPAVYFAKNVRSAVQVARSKSRPLLIFTTSPGSGRDHQLAGEVFSRPSIGQEARRFVALRLSVNQTRQLLGEQAKSTHPVLYVADSVTGKLLAEPIVGYFSATEALNLMDEGLKEFGRLRVSETMLTLRDATADDQARTAAIDQLSIYHSPDIRQLLTGIVRDDLASLPVRQAAIEALAQSAGSGAVSDLTALVDSRHGELAMVAIGALARQGLDDLENVIERLCSEDEPERVEAASLARLLVPKRLAGTEQFWQTATERQRILAIRRLQQYAAQQRRQLRQSAGIEAALPDAGGRPSGGQIASANVTTSKEGGYVTLRIEVARGNPLEVPVLTKPSD
ncbi:MAG TPA: hypothetical protein VMZ31_13055 [Phycisphaerae bacterium]|nr:hypothetical protein [Phycisphaerae bacterium]